MCGVVGIWGSSNSALSGQISAMVEAIRYRGPDDSGVWCDPFLGLGLGHARLSILDLSPEGHQPMVSASGRYVISYNGEVYNFGVLRSELETCGARFRGHSDTEVMLAAFEQWGIGKAVPRFVGMFAFALWDREARVLHLVRDRLGIKPLYYGWIGETFVFGSELKALKQISAFAASIHREALVAFMRYGYVPTPLSIYQNVYKLTPGCILAITPDRARSPQGFSPEPDRGQTQWSPTRYWSARAIVESGVNDSFEGTEREALDHLDDLLRQAIRLRMISDVPLGAFLSGGVDSSLVVSLMQAQSPKPVQTFTIGFHEDRYDEAIYAKKVAQHLGTQHTELYVTPDQARAVIPKLPTLYDEPFADSSQIPTFLVSDLACRHVTVSLSGDGGDELFGGYNRYFWWRKIWKRFGWMPLSARGGIAKAMTIVPAQSWDRAVSALAGFAPSRSWPHAPGDKIHKLAEILQFSSPEDMYRRLVSQWNNPEDVVIAANGSVASLTSPDQWADLPNFTQQMMYRDLVTYLPDDILTKVDRASMGVSLEARVPLLDHRVVEFAWRLPLSFKVKREGEGKWLLRELLHRYVPKSLTDRPKMGFGVPIDRWLRGPLRGWAEDLLSESRLRSEGFFHPAPIRDKWAEHLSGRRNWQYPLWNVLMFQAWLSAHERSPAPAFSHH